MFHVLLICCSISKDKLVALCKWYKENGLVPRKNKSGGRTTRCLLIDDIRKLWLSSATTPKTTLYVFQVGFHPTSRAASSCCLLAPKSAIFRLYEDTQNKTGKALLFFLTQ